MKFKSIGSAIGRYALRTLLGFDQYCNTIIGGDPDETISARTGRLSKRAGWKQLGWVLDKLQTDHIKKAIEHERDGSQQNAAYRDLYEAYRLKMAADEAAAKAAEVAAETAAVAEKAAEAVK